MLSHILHTCCVLSHLSLYGSTQATAVIKIRRATHRPSFLFIFHGALIFLVASNNFSLVRFEEGSHSPLAGGFLFDRNKRRKKWIFQIRKFKMCHIVSFCFLFLSLAVCVAGIYIFPNQVIMR